MIITSSSNYTTRRDMWLFWVIGTRFAGGFQVFGIHLKYYESNGFYTRIQQILLGKCLKKFKILKFQIFVFFVVDFDKLVGGFQHSCLLWNDQRVILNKSGTKKDHVRLTFSQENPLDSGRESIGFVIFEVDSKNPKFTRNTSSNNPKQPNLLRMSRLGVKQSLLLQKQKTKIENNLFDLPVFSHL